MKLKYKINDRIVIGGVNCLIVKIDSFSATPHYGIQGFDEHCCGVVGWIPCQIADNIGEFTSTL